MMCNIFGETSSRQIGHLSSIYYVTLSDFAQFSPLPTDLKAQVISNNLSHRIKFLI